MSEIRACYPLYFNTHTQFEFFETTSINITIGKSAYKFFLLLKKLNLPIMKIKFCKILKKSCVSVQESGAAATVKGLNLEALDFNIFYI